MTDPGESVRENDYQDRAFIVALESIDGTPSTRALETLSAVMRFSRVDHIRVVAVSRHHLSSAGLELLRSSGCISLFVPTRQLDADKHEPDVWTDLLSAALERFAWGVVVLPHSLLGSEVAARVAFRLGSAVVTNCESMAWSDGRLVVSRACFGGRLEEEIVVNAARSVVTLGANATVHTPTWGACAPSDDLAVHQVELSLMQRPSAIECLRRDLETESMGPSLESATLVVGGGRGLGAPQAFGELSKLAEQLDAAAGASRVACDLGWCPKSWQIGLSGRSIRANWYLAFGISGASHHMAGCSKVGNLVAINSDPTSEIFRHATYGVVADAPAVLRELIFLLESARPS